jgi:hypothetical protein
MIRFGSRSIRSTRKVLGTSLICLGLAAPAYALPITYTFTGTVSELNGNAANLGLFLPGVGIGTTFHGAATIDPDSPNGVLAMTVGTTTLSTGRTANLFIGNNGTNGDQLNFNAHTFLIAPLFRAELMRLMLNDPTGTALPNTNVPSDLSGFGNRRVSFIGAVGEQLDIISFAGQVRTFTAVPEPGTITLLGCCAALLGLRRARAKSRARRSA